MNFRDFRGIISRGNWTELDGIEVNDLQLVGGGEEAVEIVDGDGLWRVVVDVVRRWRQRRGVEGGERLVVGPRDTHDAGRRSARYMLLLLLR